jgi:hypothetical protein
MGSWASIFIRRTELGGSMLVVCIFGRLTDGTAKELRKAFEKKITLLFYADTTSLKL